MEFPNWMIDFVKMKYITFSFEQLNKKMQEIEMSRCLFGSQSSPSKVSFFLQCRKMQLIPLKKFNIETCFFQFLWFFRLKCWFKGQIISRIHLSLPNWCVLIEISMEIGMLNFWLPLLVTALTKENYFRNPKQKKN